MPETIEAVMKRYSVLRKRFDIEHLSGGEIHQLSNDSRRIADHACEVMPKLVEAIRQADRMLRTCCLSAADEAIFDMLADALADAAVNATKGKP
jgi:hypothetical protein